MLTILSLGEKPLPCFTNRSLKDGAGAREPPARHASSPRRLSAEFLSRQSPCLGCQQGPCEDAANSRRG